MSFLREVILDIETTGLRYEEGHMIIEIGCVEVIDNVITDNFFHSYVKPKDRKVMEDAYKIHGISTQFLQDKPVFEEIYEELLGFIGTSNIVAHNAAFDMGFINNELGMLGVNRIDGGRVIDTLAIARKRFPGAPVSLDALCSKFRISLADRIKHGALVDARLLAMVFIQMRKAKQESIALERNYILPKHTSKNYVRPARLPQPPTDEELDMHRKALKKITSPIWYTNKV